VFNQNVLELSDCWTCPLFLQSTHVSMMAKRINLSLWYQIVKQGLLYWYMWLHRDQFLEERLLTNQHDQRDHELEDWDVEVLV
jgi:hypothetical protein